MMLSHNQPGPDQGQLFTGPANKFLFFLLFVSVILQACAKNTLTSTWVDESFNGPITGKVLVVGIFRDPTTHKIFEDSLVESLVKSGADAVPSYPYGLEEERHSKKWLHQAMSQSGASFVLLTHLSDEKKQVYKAAPHGFILGGGTDGDGIEGYHSYMVGVTLELGNTKTKTEDYITATLFNFQSDKPIWSSTSKSVNLDRYLRADDEKLGDLLIKDLKGHHLLKS